MLVKLPFFIIILPNSVYLWMLPNLGKHESKAWHAFLSVVARQQPRALARIDPEDVATFIATASGPFGMASSSYYYK